MVLLTGATGFLGTHIAGKLLQEKIPFKVLVRPNSQLSSLKDLPVEKVLGNPFSIDSLQETFDGVETIIHCAGVTKGISYQDYYKGNVLYTENLIQAAKKYGKINKFILISSQAASGPSAENGSLKKEGELDNPFTFYGISKLEAEKKLEASGLPYLVLRPCSIYGPGDHEFFPLFKLAKKKISFFVGKGNNQVNLIHVKDMADAVVQAVRTPISRQVYFVAGDGEYSWKDVNRFAEEAVGKKTFKIKLPKWTAVVFGFLVSFFAEILRKPFLLNKEKIREMLCPYWVFDSSKIKKDLNFEPKILPQEGFKETFQWYRKEGWL
ncbi:MAG TPA: hypothetical protein DHW82_01495 [Spirochaetia bacterium]|nr:MAG: hypothetical protein A2Y41_12930 [Spirochaetes bacterium GWB1_36_13]HCL55671.1 hypothetical protein [Spirochaetia bacterium]